jgi:hypothetical protein
VNPGISEAEIWATGEVPAELGPHLVASEMYGSNLQRMWKEEEEVYPVILM